MRGFSFASVILSYFLVGGGMFTGTLVAGALKLESQLVGYLFLAAGAAFGGFVAGRASRGQTVLEPALGAIAVVATVIGLAASTWIGKLIWANAQDEILKFVAAAGATSVGGAIAGAFVSEKLLGEATRSAVPWVLYTALATFGASLLATLVCSILFATSKVTGTQDELGVIMLAGIGAGCLLAGIAVGVSARTRPLLAALLGGGIGVAGFFLLVTRAATGGMGSRSEDAAAGIAVLAVGGCVVTLIGTLVGWATVGRRQAS